MKQNYEFLNEKKKSEIVIKYKNEENEETEEIFYLLENNEYLTNSITLTNNNLLPTDKTFTQYINESATSDYNYISAVANNGIIIIIYLDAIQTLSVYKILKTIHELKESQNLNTEESILINLQNEMITNLDKMKLKYPNNHNEKHYGILTNDNNIKFLFYLHNPNDPNDQNDPNDPKTQNNGGKKARSKKSKKRSSKCKRNTKCRRTMRKKRKMRK
jgi:hypothetical protein